ncbi:MAG TPA: hypothetical protein VEQ58_08210, partial [Polyangiaceae bacterium]|nr:hypothetical protein [Polyangiaceae bacterium]
FAFSLFVGGGVGNVAMGFVVERRGYASSFTLAGVAFLVFAVIASRTLLRGAKRDARAATANVL